MKLYEITSGYQIIQNMLEEGDNNKVVVDTLDSINDELEEKFGNCAYIIKNLEAQEKAFKEEAERLARKANTVKKSIASLKQYVMQNMELAGRVKINTPICTIWKQKNPKESVVIDNPLLIPQEYWRNNPDIVKSLIYDDISNGKEVPGAKLEQGYHLRIQ